MIRFVTSSVAAEQLHLQFIDGKMLNTCIMNCIEVCITYLK